MRVFLSRGDVSMILTSFDYSKYYIRNSQNYPSGPDGCKMRRESLDAISAVMNKLRAARDKSRQSTQ